MSPFVIRANSVRAANQRETAPLQGSTQQNARRAGLGASRRSARRAARVPAGQYKRRRTLGELREARVRPLGIPAHFQCSNVGQSRTAAYRLKS